MHNYCVIYLCIHVYCQSASKQNVFYALCAINHAVCIALFLFIIKDLHRFNHIVLDLSINLTIKYCSFIKKPQLCKKA